MKHVAIRRLGRSLSRSRCVVGRRLDGGRLVAALLLVEQEPEPFPHLRVVARHRGGCRPAVTEYLALNESWFLMRLGDPEVTANLYCNFAYPYREGCVICSIYLR